MSLIWEKIFGSYEVHCQHKIAHSSSVHNSGDTFLNRPGLFSLLRGQKEFAKLINQYFFEHHSG